MMPNNQSRNNWTALKTNKLNGFPLKSQTTLSASTKKTEWIYYSDCSHCCVLHICWYGIIFHEQKELLNCKVSDAHAEAARACTCPSLKCKLEIYLPALIVADWGNSATTIMRRFNRLSLFKASCLFSPETEREKSFDLNTKRCSRHYAAKTFYFYLSPRKEEVSGRSRLWNVTNR